MSGNQLAATVAALFGISGLVVYGASITLQLRTAPPTSAIAAAATAHPLDLATRRLGCTGVPKPLPGDGEIVLKGDYSDADYRAASIRMMCSDQ